MTDHLTEEKPKYAARLLDLGLTAYGQTPEEARHRLGRMLLGAMKARDEVGALTEWLQRSGLTSLWEYQEDGTWTTNKI